ncbi:hypothetical protein G9A89_013970 [Geosiphon pyriformis]|nr:hypothetical protein G9A89_013970 [Geosiphon pyriformis]
MPDATFKIKLAHVKTVFQSVHGFLDAKSMSKDNVKLFCMEFASQVSLEAAFLVELTSSVCLTTLKITKSLVVPESGSLFAAIVLHNVPLDVFAADIKTAFSIFGVIIHVVLKPTGIWQYVVVYFKNLVVATSVLNHWSVLVGKDSIWILLFVNQQETIVSCDRFKAKLVNLPLGYTAFEISDMAPKMFKPHFVSSLSYAKASVPPVLSEFPPLVAAAPSVTVVNSLVSSWLTFLESDLAKLSVLIESIVKSVGSMVKVFEQFVNGNLVSSSAFGLRVNEILVYISTFNKAVVVVLKTECDFEDVNMSSLHVGLSSFDDDMFSNLMSLWKHKSAAIKTDAFKTAKWLIGLVNNSAILFEIVQKMSFLDIKATANSTTSKKKTLKSVFHDSAGGFFSQKKKIVLGNVKYSGNKRNISLSKSEPGNSIYSDVESLYSDDENISMFGINEKSMEMTASLARKKGITINSNLKKQRIRSDWAIVIKEIPMDMPKKMIIVTVFEFGTTAYDLEILLEKAGEKTCVINYSLVTGNWICCTVVGFNLDEDLESVFYTEPIFGSVKLLWTRMNLICCERCSSFGHSALKFLLKLVSSGSSLGFGSGSGFGSLSTSISGSGVNSPFVSTNNSALNDQLTSLECSLKLLVDQVSGIVRKLSGIKLVSLAPLPHTSISAVPVTVGLDLGQDMVVDSAELVSLSSFCVISDVLALGPNSSKVLTAKVDSLESKFVAFETFVNLVLMKLDQLCAGSSLLMSSLSQ